MTESLLAFDESNRYRLLIESVTDYAIYMLDPMGVITSWNPGAQRFKGYTPPEIIGEHFSRFYTPEDLAGGLPARALATAAREGKFEGEGWRVRKDGTRFWAHVVIDPIRASDGSLSGFAKVTRDLTEKKQAEDALHHTQEQFRLLVQGVTDYAIYMLDPDGIVSNWNAGAERIKGYTPEEIVGRHFSQFYTEEDRAKDGPRQALDTARREGRFEKEGWRLRKDGSRFWAHVVIDCIRDERGDVTGFAKVTRDITERRETQRALDEAREALFQSQKMDAVGQLTGGVAHDFNNLLMAVIGSLELLRKRLPDDPQMQRLLENALQGARRGSSLTQRMLAFARRQQLDSKPLDLAGLVRGMTDLLERSLGASVTITTSFPPDLAQVIADENQLELALLNLCMNARDAMPAGGTITLGAREVQIAEAGALPAGRYVSLTVTDEGEGMDADILARATEPFFTTKGVGKGTGLGLPMVHGMSEQIGGRFTLKSQPGHGTVAEILLPAMTAMAGAQGVAEKPVHAPQHTNAMTVLAVDDDALVLFNTVAMLEDMGHTALEASSGVTALEILRRQPVDMVVTDQSMPKMTGLQLREAIHAEWPKLPVLLATGYAEIPGGAGAGIAKLDKPFSEKDLAAALDRLRLPAA